MEIYYTLIERDAENFIAFCEKNYFDKHQTKESSNKLEKVSEILNDMSCDKISSHIHDLNTSETTIKQHMAIYSIKMIRNDDIYKLK